MRYCNKKVIRNDEDEKIALTMLKNINEEWTVEAKREDTKYFYSFDLVEKTKKGKISFILGRKGTGKTAISERIASSLNDNEFSRQLNFQNFPFELIYSNEDNIYSSPKQYTSIWKYIIYNSICEMMATNQNIDASVYANLNKLYKDCIDANDGLGDIVSCLVTKQFQINIAGSGISYSEDQKEKNISWIDTKNTFEKIIKQYGGDYTYYVLIDELDEDYRNFKTEDDKEKYFELLTSLFKAVQDIRSTFDKTNTKVLPVVFLRTDIYNQIKDSDKNKWREFTASLSWTRENLKELLSYRLSVASEKKIRLNSSWDFLFPDDAIFEHFVRCSQLRPRDFISYIKLCVNFALENEESFISMDTVKKCEIDYSDILYQEIFDEAFVSIPNFERALSVFSNLRKNTIDAKEFIEKYSSMERVSEGEGIKVLEQLYDLGVIGNMPDDINHPIFKYRNSRVPLNFDEPIIVHTGLRKALQVNPFN